MSLDIESIYRQNNALLQGHFLLSSGNHTKFYLQSAKVLENPKTAELLATELAKQIIESTIQIDCVCSPALGGILAGYELARSLGVRFIFTERVNGIMALRRGFEVKTNENILICEDIITTGGSAMESAECIKNAGGKIVAFAGLANRGFCRRILPHTTHSTQEIKTESWKQFSMPQSKKECKLTQNIPLFALADFEFEIYDSQDCPLCKDSVAYKPGSR
ncbi:orotate phosphoribosyltransferase [Helicobacter didelphidarum]|uniref:Orotate phosphoribosyltransferase n=1 Tax=Helicobacter didelphidarum TaxID=2040648 RepID=A0A3D8IK52_9HELI|nr:orotate phosphoribosyltransferase [Helicobacter didelphidarum]RDU65400.1 orotate phosphoribosyltransferase [Helicobacter didelphidarum]